MRIFILVGVLLTLAACPSGGGAFRAKCDVSCRAAATSCSKVDVTKCTNDCDTASAGLPTLCGQCIAEHTAANEVPCNSSSATSCTCPGTYYIPTSTGFDCNTACAVK